MSIIDSIHKSEDLANKLKQDALEKNKELLEQTNESSVLEAKNLLEKAKNEIQEDNIRCENLRKEEALKIKNQCETECDSLNKIADLNKQKAIDIIMRRIVN